MGFGCTVGNLLFFGLMWQILAFHNATIIAFCHCGSGQCEIGTYFLDQKI